MSLVLLCVSSSSFASNWTHEEAQEFCLRSHPCYYEDDQWHLYDGKGGSSSNWGSFEISSFTSGLILAVSIPIANIVINRFLDYAAYKWDRCAFLKDGGRAAQTKILREISTSLTEVVEHFVSDPPLGNQAVSPSQGMEETNSQGEAESFSSSFSRSVLDGSSSSSQGLQDLVED